MSSCLEASCKEKAVKDMEAVNHRYTMAHQKVQALSGCRRCGPREADLRVKWLLYPRMWMESLGCATFVVVNVNLGMG